MFLLQNVYTSKESTSYIVSSKLLQTLEAAIKERIDWNNLQGRMIQAENEAISAAIDTIINKG